jgi:hypothetical protein
LVDPTGSRGFYLGFRYVLLAQIHPRSRDSCLMLSPSAPARVQGPRRELQREVPNLVIGEARVGVRVRVRAHHRIAERRGMVGTVVESYGGEEHVAVDVRFPNGERRLFWPGDLETLSSPRTPWWRSRLVGGSSG